MKINFSEKFLFALNQQVNYIAANKPIAARNFERID